MSQPPDPPPQGIAYAPMTPQDARDASHLSILAIFHYVAGAFILLGGCCGLVYVGLGFGMATGSIPQQPNNPDASWMGLFMGGMGVFILLLGWALAGVTFYSAYSMQKRRRRVFSIVIAALLCTSFPFGTILGVFTLIVLCRPSVIAAYESRPVS